MGLTAESEPTGEEFFKSMSVIIHNSNTHFSICFFVFGQFIRLAIDMVSVPNLPIKSPEFPHQKRWVGGREGGRAGCV